MGCRNKSLEARVDPSLSTKRAARVLKFSQFNFYNGDALFEHGDKRMEEKKSEGIYLPVVIDANKKRWVELHHTEINHTELQDWDYILLDVENKMIVFLRATDAKDYDIELCQSCDEYAHCHKCVPTAEKDYLKYAHRYKIILKVPLMLWMHLTNNVHKMFFNYHGIVELVEKFNQGHSES